MASVLQTEITNPGKQLNIHSIIGRSWQLISDFSLINDAYVKNLFKLGQDKEANSDQQELIWDLI
jgi:hypothetical protein